MAQRALDEPRRGSFPSPLLPSAPADCEPEAQPAEADEVFERHSPSPQQASKNAVAQTQVMARSVSGIVGLQLQHTLGRVVRDAVAGTLCPQFVPLYANEATPKLHRRATC